MAARRTTAAATLHDVARAAGVSLATASRVLNGSARKVQGEYRERVEAAAAELGYSANPAAQAVARGTTSTIALLVSDITDPYFSGIASGVIAAADAARLDVRIAVTDRDPDKELGLVRSLRGGRPRAIVLAGSRFAADRHRDALIAELQAYEASGGRVAMISQGGLPFPSVQVDNRAGARALAAALAEAGYRRCAIVRGPEAVLTSSDRVAGFLDGMTSAGVSVDSSLIVEAPLTRDGAFDAAGALLADRSGDIDLVFAVTDLMAVGVASAMRAAGLEPGAGTGVAGFDDAPIAEDVHPGLTTVAVPLAALGERAVAAALGDEADGASVELPTRVVLRASTPRRAAPDA